MLSRRVESIDRYLAPDSSAWEAQLTASIPLAPTPLGMQPTAYVRNAWAGRPYGASDGLEVASVHDGLTWALRACWIGSGTGVTDFPDALAVALPVRKDAVLALMGADEAPIHYLRWSSNRPGVLSLLATGIGSSRPGPVLHCAANAVAEGTVWRVVIARELGSGSGAAPLSPGASTGVGFALWQGANEERAGTKAFSIDWTELALEA